MRSLVRYFGGKYFINKWIRSFFPKHTIYCEPFIGGGTVFLNKETSQTEIINDLNVDIYCLWKTLKYESEKFINTINPITYNKEVWLSAGGRNGRHKFVENNWTDFQRAINQYIILRMSRGGEGLMFSVPGIKDEVKYFENAKTKLPWIVNRLQKTSIFNKPALEIIAAYDRPETLFFLDPPYLLSTRKKRSVYKHEMTLEQHAELANVLMQIKGKVILSGYESPEYSLWFKLKYFHY